MKQAFCRFIYHTLLGWKAKVSVPDFDKCIICAAPHTTNWDLFIGKLFIGAVGRESGFLMKRSGSSFRWAPSSDGWEVFPYTGANGHPW